MFWRDDESIDEEESCQEMDKQKDLSVCVTTPSLVALEDLPVLDAILAVTTEPVISSDTTFVHHKQSKADSWNIGHANIKEDMIPPALSKVR